ncbi:monooxygenase family protein, partial [Microbacterium sp. Bi128]|uniref:monooxygenase family protein n=1 Tax=Microbacterium sp. Bi128 TaxID=2821115 RepID=UPI001E5DC341
LYAYASAPQSEHRPAWAAFNRQARKAPKAVGIWHETFQVSRAESMYVSMPTEGLAQATELLPVGPGSQQAKDRLSNPG